MYEKHDDTSGVKILFTWDQKFRGWQQHSQIVMKMTAGHKPIAKLCFSHFIALSAELTRKWLNPPLRIILITPEQTINRKLYCCERKMNPRPQIINEARWRGWSDLASQRNENARSAAAAGAGCNSCVPELMMFRECIQTTSNLWPRETRISCQSRSFQSLWFPGRRRLPAFCLRAARCVASECAWCFFNVSAPLLPRNTRIIIEQVSGCLGTLHALQQIMQQALSSMRCPLQPTHTPPPSLWLIIERKCAARKHTSASRTTADATWLAANQWISQLLIVSSKLS
jgi:hypothetical protein